MDTGTRDAVPDLALGLSAVAIVAAVLSALWSYEYAVAHAAERGTGTLQGDAAVAFGVAMLAAALAVAVVHVRDA